MNKTISQAIKNINEKNFTGAAEKINSVLVEKALKQIDERKIAIAHTVLSK